MAFTDAQKTDIRRFCNLPAFGASPVQAFGWRFETWYGTVEFFMNNLQPTEEAVVIDYLTKLNQLETDIFDSRLNLDTDSAAVWYHNKNEVRDRQNLFNVWQIKLCVMFKMPLEFVSSFLGTSIRVVV